MTAQKLDLDRVLDDFLADSTQGSCRIACSTLALGDIETHPSSGGAWRVPRRSDMPVPLRLLAAAAPPCGGGRRRVPSRRKPETDDSARACPVATADHGGRHTIEIGSEINGTWVSYSPAVFGSQTGDYTMTLTRSPSLAVKGPDGRDIFLGLLDREQPKGRAVLGTTDLCSGPGTYTYALSDDFHEMTIGQVSDSCAERAKLLASRLDSNLDR